VFAFYLVSMMALVGLQSFTTVLAVDAYGFTESTANTLLTVHLTCTAVGVVAGGPLADRASFRWVVVGMLVLSAIGVWILVLGVSSTSFIVALVLLALIGLLFGLALPSRDKFANSVADPEAVGKSFGFFFTGLSLGAVVSPALLGAIIDIWSAPAAFVVVSVLLVIAASVVVVAVYADAKA
jgi:MFS family permease